jgi:hypothetical protein
MAEHNSRASSVGWRGAASRPRKRSDPRQQIAVAMAKQVALTHLGK